MPRHCIIDVAEIAGDADPSAVARFDHETRRIRRVVQRPAGVHVQLTNRERAVVVEDDDRSFRAIDQTVVERSARQIDGNGKLAGDALRAANVVVMFVGDDERLQVRQLAPNLFQPPRRLPRAKTRVDEDARPVALEIVRISRAPRSERRNDHKFMVAGLLGCFVAGFLRLPQ